MILCFCDVTVWCWLVLSAAQILREKERQSRLILWFPNHLHSFSVQTSWCLKMIPLLKKEFPGICETEVRPCACELLGCVNGEELKWGNLRFFSDFFFYHLVLILQGKAVFLPFRFHMHTHPKAIGICGVTSGAGGDGEGCPFLGDFLVFLGVVVIPCSSSSVPVQLWPCNTKFIWCNDVLTCWKVVMSWRLR